MEITERTEKKLRLRTGAVLHFLIAIGHLACLFFLDEAFKAYGISEQMNSLCFGHAWVLYAITVCLAMAFAAAALYALAASGDIIKLPLQRLAIITIIAVYGTRTIIGVCWLAEEFSWLQFFSTLVPAILVWCYLPGVNKNKEKLV